MRQSQKFSKVIDIYSYRRCWQQTLALLSILLFSLGSSSVFAAVNCEAGFIPDNFSNADYGILASNSPPPTNGSYELLDGEANENYVLFANSFTTSGSLDSGGKNTYKSTVTDRVQNFEFFQDFATPETTRTVSYTFKNEFTGQEQELNKVSLSVYDIDSNVSLDPIPFFRPRYFEFFDEVTIKGFTSLGAPVSHTVNSKGSTITNAATNAATYRQQNTSDDFACSGLSNNCKVSVTFDNPVARVDIVYGNNTDLRYYYNNRFNNPGDQLINIVFDGYCYQPQPRLTYTKALSTSRKKNTDQFTVQIKDNADNSVVTSGITSVTTTGSNNTVTTGTGTTGTFKVNPTKTYTLTESGSGSTNLADYNALYACRKSGPNGATITTLNPNSLQLTYGDDWTCTVTNGLKSYTFTGYVFNDNGGISSEDKFDTSSTFTGNSSYFNGQFDSSIESGVSHPDLKVSLNDCNGSIIDATNSPNPQSIPISGQYSFIVKTDKLPNNNTVCITEIEPDPWNDYPVDTTPNEYEFTLKSGVFNYKTGVQDNAGNTLNLDFGQVIKNQSALVLTKSQYVHQCDNTLDLTNPAINQPTSNPMIGFSDQPPQTSVEPGNCIAYRIQAYNRGHIGLQQVQIRDQLQITPVTSVFQQPAPLFIPTSVNSPTVSYGSNGEIRSNLFSLAATPVTASQPNSATLYFNTKYGTTQSN
uniref:hypothetical protein n=1 Tax=uncultured Psychrobacter sp. TaxID=259303 RepID=UPI00261FE953|nr:hypothetical protein [uncultured Psychrobacter sp.]